MSARKARPPSLRPLTQIAPQNSDPSRQSPADLGTTSKGSIASASAGSRPRSKSSAGKTASAPTASTGGVGIAASTASSRASSRRSSFAPHVAGHRKPSMVAREATSSRRGSMWSSFGEGGASGPANMTEEEKAQEARKAFNRSFRTIWDSGVDKISGDLWDSLVTGWKSGDIIGLFSIDVLELSRTEHARAIVLVDDLCAQLQTLAVTSLALPGATKSLRALDRAGLDFFLDQLLDSPPHLSLLLRVLETFSKLSLQILPTFIAHLEYPETLNPAFFSLINLVTFLAGSSTDLRRAIVSFMKIMAELSTVIDSFTRAVIDIAVRLPPDGAAPHPCGDFLYSPAHTSKQFAELRGHIKSLFAQPSFVNATEIFDAEVRATWNGLVGNARVARAARNAERVWNNSWSDYKYKVASLLEALDALQWEIAPISSDTEEFSYTFTALRPHFPSLLPNDVSVAYGSGAIGDGAPSSIILRKIRIEIRSASYEITKRGLLAFTDSGSATITVPLDVEIDFTLGHLRVTPRVTGKADVVLHTTNKSTLSALTKVWNAWLSMVVSAKFAECVEHRISEAFNSWLEPLFEQALVLKPALPFSTSSPVATVADQPAVMIPSSAPLSRQASLSRRWEMSPSAAFTPGTKTPPPAAPVGARAAFLASLRMSSGIDIRPLATGRDVLESLANPFSGPNSAIGNLGGDDDDEGSNAGGFKSRSMSMAMSLTEIAKTDSTEMMNIQNPPRSRSLSHILLDDGPRAFVSNGPAGRRLSLVYTPAGEPSLDAYDHEAGTQTPQAAHQVPMAIPRGRALSMAEHLDEQSQQDTTTPKSIAAQAQQGRAGRSTRGFPVETEETSRPNVSMTRVTMELQGHRTPLEQEYETSTQAAAAGGRRREPYGGVDTSPTTRRKSMSEYLTEAAMADTTDPTVNPSSRRSSNKDEPVPLAGHRPSMSAVLDHVSSVDMTLPENIASPPRSHRASFAPGSESIRTRTKSFTALEDVPSMAQIGIDDKISNDVTEAAVAPEVPRRKSAAPDEYTGIDPAELKKRRMSSFATDATNVDTTLLQNIETPPIVDQNYNDVTSKAHSLATRQQNATAAGKA